MSLIVLEPHHTNCLDFQCDYELNSYVLCSCLCYRQETSTSSFTEVSSSGEQVEV